MRAPYICVDGFRFAVSRADALVSFFGLQDVKVGDPALDRAFRIRGNNETKLRALFANERIRQLMHDLPPVRLHVVPKKRDLYCLFFGPSGVDQLWLMWYVRSPEIGELRSLYALMTETLNQLCLIGSARADNPKLVL